MIDTGSAAVIGSVLVLAGIVYQGERTRRRGDEQGERIIEAEGAEAAEAAERQPFLDNLALTKYIREEVRLGVEEQTRQLREDRERDRRDLAEVKRILGNVYSRLDRTLQAVREYIRQVHDQWGKADEPPPIGAHLSELLESVDDDTWTRVKIEQLQRAHREEQQEQPDTYG